MMADCQACEGQGILASLEICPKCTGTGVEGLAMTNNVIDVLSKENERLRAQLNAAQKVTLDVARMLDCDTMMLLGRCTEIKGLLDYAQKEESYRHLVLQRIRQWDDAQTKSMLPKQLQKDLNAALNKG